MHFYSHELARHSKLFNQRCHTMVLMTLSQNAQQAALSRPAIDTPFSWKQFSVCGSRYCELVPCQSPSHELFRFVLPDYYSVIKPIGQGAYGIVWYVFNQSALTFIAHLLSSSATNQRTAKNVAIKKIANAFEHVIDTKRTLREAKVFLEKN